MERPFLTALLMAVAWMPVAAAAQSPPDPALYRSQVIVTGLDMRSRPEAILRCVEQVLVKLAADPSLNDDPNLIGLVQGRSDPLESFIYLDRMTDQPLHDEQGTRDRPFDFIADVAPAQARRTLELLGRTPWLNPRPRLLALVEVERGPDRFALLADGDHGERQRQALFAAGVLYGMRGSLPAALRVGLEPDAAQARDVRPASDIAVLRGQLRWSDADLGWVAD